MHRIQLTKVYDPKAYDPKAYDPKVYDPKTLGSRVPRIIGYGVGFLIFFLVACATYVEIRVVRGIPPAVAEVMRNKKNVGVIAVKSKEDYLRALGLPLNWPKIVQGAVRNAFEKYGYYRIVEIEHRRRLLEEIAYSNTGLTASVKKVGKQLGVDALLWVTMTAPPVRECKVEIRTDKAAMVAAVLSVASGGSSDAPARAPTGVLYMTVFVQGKLVSVETALSALYANNKPFKLENEIGNRECPSLLKGFNKALEFASNRVADHLSPKLVPMRVPVSDSPEGSPAAVKSRVQALLVQGVHWIKADPPNYEQAESVWKEALKTSQFSSPSAFWNLAVMRWYRGDMVGAEEYFKKAERKGGVGYISGSRMNVFSRFLQERKRMKQERAAEDR